MALLQGGIIPIEVLSKIEENVRVGHKPTDDLVARTSTFMHQDLEAVGEEVDGQKTQTHLSGAVADNAMKVLNNLRFYEIQKEQRERPATDIYANDIQHIFMESMTAATEILLPIINKVENGVLPLQDYTLSIGQCRGLAAVMEKTKLPIETLFLDNCGVDDEELADLFKGFQAIDDFRRFYYKDNGFYANALEAIQPILVKPSPNNLRELRLVNCKTSDKFVNQLVQFLATRNFSLKSLGLISMQLSAAGLEYLCDFLERAYWLEDLDISWNDFRPQDCRRFFQLLAANRTLQTLNMSMNAILSFND